MSSSHNSAAMLDLFLENVTKKFGMTVAVDNVTLEIKRGELLFLLGPSGCGKTTTLRIIAGFTKPDQGNVYILGNLMNSVPVNKRKLGMVFQNYALFPHMTVYQNIAFGLRLRKVPKYVINSKTKEMIKLVRLDENFEDRYPSQMSGGQQQRVSLARALVTAPNVLLLDEPFGALDRKLRKEMQVELKELHKQLPITTIFVTHDQEEALSMADRIAVMHNGKIVQVDTPDSIYEKPKTRFVSEFIGESNFFIGSVVEVLKGVATIDTEDNMVIHANAQGEDFRKGKRVYVAIRPEKIKVLPNKSSNPANLFPGTVEGMSYLGDKTYYYIRARSGKKLIACGQNVGTTSSKKEYTEGDEVFVQWNTKNSILLDG